MFNSLCNFLKNVLKYSGGRNPAYGQAVAAGGFTQQGITDHRNTACLGLKASQAPKVPHLLSSTRNKPDETFKLL